MNAPCDAPAPASSDVASQTLPPPQERRSVRKAVILAAGRGSRMGKLTADRPKGALEVGGHALIDWQIEALKTAGVTEIAIVTGHAAEALAGRDVTYIHNPDWRSVTQVDTLLKASDWIGDEPVIVSYSDIIYHPSAPLALLERPGDVIVSYDADHRWLWKRRFGDWLHDSETFKLGPGQVLAEIGKKPTCIGEIDGQFMGLFLLSAEGRQTLARAFAELTKTRGMKADFTALISHLLRIGCRIDTAANLLPWIEVDSAKDLRIARAMARADEAAGHPPALIYPATHSPSAVHTDPNIDSLSSFSDRAKTDESRMQSEDALLPQITLPISNSRFDGFSAFAIQNWGRSGSTYLQSLLDNHPQVLSTPNFYSRHFYTAWALTISHLPDEQKIEAFLNSFKQWWDPALVDASAGLHRLGKDQQNIAGVKKEHFEFCLRRALEGRHQITRRTLFIAAHVAYAASRGQEIAKDGLQILFPIHGEPRGVAAAFLEDFPTAKFLHTLRDPVANVISSINHLHSNSLDIRHDALTSSLGMLFGARSHRGRDYFTLFGDKPYFSWLPRRDQACSVRLEDLNEKTETIMAAVAAWLGMAMCDQLLESTWDGQTWWNRPEIVSARSRTTHINLLSSRDADRIRDLSARSPSIKAAYPSIATTGRRLFLRMLPARLSRRWHFHTLFDPSSSQRLAALGAVRRFLPLAFESSLDSRLSRERQRSKLRAMNVGALFVRRDIPDERKHASVRGALLLSPAGEDWRIRALVNLDEKHKRPDDRIEVIYLDEAMSTTTLSDSLFWIFTILVGGALARIQARLRLFALGSAHLNKASTREKTDAKMRIISI